MPRIINWDIVVHPVNWFTLFLMVFIAGIVLHFIFTHYQNQASSIAQSASTSIGAFVNAASSPVPGPGS